MNESLLENIIRLIKLSRVLPISNASIERVFSSVSFIKNKYRNRLLNDTLDNILFVNLLNINQVDFS